MVFVNIHNNLLICLHTLHTQTVSTPLYLAEYICILYANLILEELFSPGEEILEINMSTKLTISPFFDTVYFPCQFFENINLESQRPDRRYSMVLNWERQDFFLDSSFRTVNSTGGALPSDRSDVFSKTRLWSSYTPLKMLNTAFLANCTYKEAVKWRTFSRCG